MTLHVHVHVSIPHSGNIHRLSGKASTFSTFSTFSAFFLQFCLFILNLVETQNFINEFRLRETPSPSNRVHITLIVQGGYWMHLLFRQKILVVAITGQTP